MTCPTTRVILRQSWVVLTLTTDPDGIGDIDDEEFEGQAAALRYAAQQANKHGVVIDHGW